MTSSFDNFGNVVGTPRDKLPDISDTNYLRTEADLTEVIGFFNSCATSAANSAI